MRGVFWKSRLTLNFSDMTLEPCPKENIFCDLVSLGFFLKLSRAKVKIHKTKHKSKNFLRVNHILVYHLNFFGRWMYSQKLIGLNKCLTCIFLPFILIYNWCNKWGPDIALAPLVQLSKLLEVSIVFWQKPNELSYAPNKYMAWLICMFVQCR